MRQVELMLLIITIILAIVLFLAVLPVELRFFYKWGQGEHSLLLRLEFFQKRVGLGTKLYFDGTGYYHKSRFTNPFCVNREKEHYKIRSLEDVSMIFLRYQKLLRYIGEFMKRSNCRSFNWKTKIGFSDYALTGMTTGLLWAGKGMILEYLTRSVRLDSHRVQVCIEPFWGRQYWESSINCILTTKLGHIIIVFSRFWFWLFNDSWKNKER